MINPMTRDDVLDVLDKVVRLKGRGVARADVPVKFMEDRVAVVLPAEKFTPDERIRLEGKFQNLVTTRLRGHAFLDFADDWNGLEPAIRGGFS
jgi:hypothetical protein